MSPPQFAALQAVAKRLHEFVNRFADQINYFDYQIFKCILTADGLGFWVVPGGGSLKCSAFRAGWRNDAKRLSGFSRGQGAGLRWGFNSPAKLVPFPESNLEG